jgi:hypothetical protein
LGVADTTGKPGVAEVEMLAEVGVELGISTV